MSKQYCTSRTPSINKEQDRCLRGALHLNNGMKLLVVVGTVVILALAAVLFLKFKKAMFVLLVPSAIVILTIAALTTKRPRLTWPIIAVSCFHVVLSAYLLLVFSFYFFVKPLYIIMVTNWAFDTMYAGKNAVFYVQSGVVYLSLTVFLLFNLWQATVAYSYRNMLIRDRDLASGPQPTVLIVNKPIEFVSSQY